MAQWTYQIADLRTNVVIGDLPLSSPTVVKVLNDCGTLTGQTLPLADPRMRNLNVYDMTMPARRAIYAIRDAQPWWGGIIWTREYDSEADVVSIGAADFWSYFDHRKILPIFSVPPGTFTTVAGFTVSYTGIDQNTLARNLVSQAQLHSGGDIGVVGDSTVSGTTRDRTYYGYELGNVADRLRQLCNVQGGPDILFEPNGYDAQGRPVRRMRVGTPTLGQQGSPHVWESGGNLAKYRWPSDGTKMATRMFGVGDGIDQAALIAVAEDAAKYTNGWPLLEAENGYTTVSDTATLQQHANADQVAARLPVALPAMVVRGNLAPRLGEYGVGDDARLIIKDNFFRNGIDVRTRITRIEVQPTDAVELVTLTMPPLTEEVA